jgi:small GTP-binding protein
MLSKKVCMLGSLSVGKTSLVRRFIQSMFSEDYFTSIGVKVDKKMVHVKDQDVELVLWDIYGHDIFQKVQMSYLRGMSGYLLVVDGTRKQTLEDALALSERVAKEIGKVPAILALNKSDLIGDWEIDSDREAKLTEDGWKLIRTSAKTGDAVEQAFSELANAMLQK